MKRKIKISAMVAAMLGTGVALFAFLNARAATRLPVLPPAVSTVVARPVLPSVADPGALDEKRRFALGMIETGNDDREIGGAGEISRYQIMPSVWRQYSGSQSYQDPKTSLAVAQQHWSVLYTNFQQQARRMPTDFDMYVLWNTRYGYYASRGFNPANLAAGVRDRAQRFVNLVNREEF